MVMKGNSMVRLTAVRQSPPTTSTLRSFDAGDSTRALVSPLLRGDWPTTLEDLERRKQEHSEPEAEAK